MITNRSCRLVHREGAYWDIGRLTQPVDPVTWLARVRSRYAFVIPLDEVERRVARCNPGHRHESQLVAAWRATR
jgi:hypothetical protein